jgi:hypothetical protein
LGVVAIAAWLVIEALLWGGVAGFGRGGANRITDDRVVAGPCVDRAITSRSNG